MKKRLLVLTDESILAGCAKSGVAEVADSIANAMAEEYAVSVVAPDGDGMFVKMAGNPEPISDGVRRVKMFGVDYYLVDWKRRRELTPALVDELSPDILHAFAWAELLEELHVRPPRTVFTIDQADFARGHEAALKEWGTVTTVSRAYAEELLARGDELSATLAALDFRGITNGILTPVFAPEKGLLLPAKFSADDLSGKERCKLRLCQVYGIPREKCVYLMTCRLVRDKGLDEVIANVHAIRDSGGVLLMVGRGDRLYEQQLRALTRADGIIFLDKWPSPVQAIPLLAGADFYLNPSISEACGLMPMTASRYGAVPVVTLNGGLRDNMDEEIAVIVGADGMSGAISRAAELYRDKTALAEKRRACMARDFSWATRKKSYLEVYGWNATEI